MNKILLIKTGAAGDVVRTTTLLSVLSGKITWVIDSRYRDLLPKQHPSLARIIDLEHASEQLAGEAFDLVLSLEEEGSCAALATTVPAKKLTGITQTNGGLTYTPDAACWFDMSLISTKGKEAANEIKKYNQLSFQHLLFQLAGYTFNGEPYCIYQHQKIEPVNRVVGIETRSGSRWPNKAWSGYPALAELLKKDGYTIKLLEQKKSLKEYLDDIAGCSFLISGDTLAMHVALAYKIPSIAIFNCTSPAEIYDYGIAHKIVSPLLLQSFYSREYSTEVVESISPETVYAIFRQHAAAATNPVKV
jgi:heptosyltransferase II